ncbi:hypothetical protein B0H16DRAFT_1756939 [Mycena metata]|uniref:Uncharacterized protein n=1 Tax=Mycena metata TaxID=1033252 RepID=A0AAD7K024_9AGAR|nr:hypothetical protein B0H16DRAFT_1756939 [Mycena metata]
MVGRKPIVWIMFALFGSALRPDKHRFVLVTLLTSPLKQVEATFPSLQADSLPPPQYFAIISPSAHHSVAYLNSTLATSAAADLNCGQYLAIVELPDSESTNAVAFFVQSARQPLPATYIPISSCRVGTREPLVLDFEWPFGECVIDTSRKLVFEPVPVESNADDEIRAKWELSERRVTKKAEQAAAGLLNEDDSRWTTFSPKSTIADPQPGQFFPPSSVSAQIRYDIESLREILPATQCLDEGEHVKRLRARFTRLGTERTIFWTMHQVFTSSGYFGDHLTPTQAARVTVKPLCAQDSTDFEHSPLFEFSTTFERPPTHDANVPPTLPDLPGDDKGDDLDDWPAGDDNDDDWFGWVQGIPTYGLPSPPLFEPQALQIIYFDVYGTLIDHHWGYLTRWDPYWLDLCCGGADTHSQQYDDDGKFAASDGMILMGNPVSRETLVENFVLSGNRVSRETPPGFSGYTGVAPAKF